jgi:restriction endonuclease S subunit
MKNWKEIEIAQVAEYWVGKIYAKSLNSNNYISTDNMLPNKGGIVESNYVPSEGRTSSFSKNDILISNIRPYFKKIWFATKNGGCSNDILVFRAKEDLIDPIYLYYQLSKDDFFDFMMAGANGTKMPRGNKDLIPHYKILLPSPLIQRKIASILSSYDALIENNCNRIKLLEETARIIYEEWFVRFKVNKKQLTIDNQTGRPKGWGLKKLHEVADINKNQIKKGFAERIKYVDISSVSPGKIDSFTEYSFEDAPSRARRIVKHGDIIWSCVRPNRRSHCLIWNPEPNLIVSTGFVVITPKDLPTSYLYQFLTTEAFVGRLTNLAGGAAYPAVAPDDFEDADLIIPPKEIIENFDKVVKPINQIISILTKQNVLLKEARDILLPKLMSGKIDVKVGEANSQTIVIPISEKKPREASWEFKEAVLIAMLTERFGSEKFPLGRKRYTKFSYLFHRYADNQVQDYLRKAAGPYNPKTKYQGPEKIAHENGYVIDHKNGNLVGFIVGKNIATAKTYFEKYWSIDYLNWLEANFKYKSNDELELYATVDHALLELYKSKKAVSLQEIKTILKTEKEWKAKLEREIFSDLNIQRAIDYLPTIFQYS